MFERAPGIGDGQGSLVYCSPWGYKESDTTERLNWTEPVWPTTAFWILEKPLHLRSTLSKSTRGTESCKARSRHWSTERAQFFSTTILNRDHTSHNQHFQSWTNWAMKFCLILHIHQLTTTSSSILTTFCRENTSTTSRRQKTLSKSSLNPEAWIFMLQE